MAIGAGGKKGKGKSNRKKAVDSMLKKEWYEVMAPAVFSKRNFCKTLVNKSSGLKMASDELKGRVFETTIADLNTDESQAYKKIKLRVEDVQGTECLTLFHGLDMTRDKLCSLFRKRHTTIEAFADVTTIDGYKLRIFVIAFTKRHAKQMKVTCYAQASQIHSLRAKIVEVVTKESSKCDLKELVDKFIPGKIERTIEKVCTPIFPIENVMIRKVKTLKRPKFDAARVLDQHTVTDVPQKNKQDVGQAVDRSVVPTVDGSGGRY